MKKPLTLQHSRPALAHDDHFLTEGEVANRLGVSRKTVARHNLRPVYLGRRKLYRWSDVVSALDGGLK
jgi:hypothetical protein